MEGPGRLVRILDNLRPSDSDRGVLDDVRVHLKCDVACAPGEEFGTPKRPIGCSVGALHLEYPTGGNGGSNFLCQVLSNHNNLQSRVDHSCFRDPVCNLDIDLMRRQ